MARRWRHKWAKIRQPIWGHTEEAAGNLTLTNVAKEMATPRLASSVRDGVAKFAPPEPSAVRIQGLHRDFIESMVGSLFIH